MRFHDQLSQKFLIHFQYVLLSMFPVPYTICCYLIVAFHLESPLKGGYPIIFASNVFHNSHLIQKCIQNQQQLLILYTFLNQMRVVKNIRRKDDRITSLQDLRVHLFSEKILPTRLLRAIFSQIQSFNALIVQIHTVRMYFSSFIFMNFFQASQKLSTKMIILYSLVVSIIFLISFLKELFQRHFS